MKKTYYFYRRNYHSSFYDIEIEAWYGEPTFYVGEEIHGESFTLLERLDLHACKKHSQPDGSKKFHCLSFRHEKGLDLCEGSCAKSEKEFLKSKIDCKSFPMEQISQSDFSRFRKVILNIWENYPDIDYEQITK